MYFLINGILALWVIADARARRANFWGWGFGTLLLSLLVLPAYFACRPLKSGEVRSGGRGWNYLKNLSVVWTLVMLVAALTGVVNTSRYIASLSSHQGSATAGAMVGFGMLGAIWFFPVLGALILGLLIKQSSVETGPVASQAVNPPKYDNKYVNTVIVVIALIALLFYVAPRMKGKLADATQSTGFSHGYQLQPNELAVVSWLIKEEASTFSAGGETTLGKLDSVSALEAAKAYDANQVGADQKYYKKPLYVTGIIESINSGLGNAPYIAFRGMSMFQLPQAHFKNANAARIATFKKGQKLSLVCEGGGAIAGTPMFKDCLFPDEATALLVTKTHNELKRFLAGDSQDEAIALFAIMGMSAARSLPDNSPCFSNEQSCDAVMGQILANKDGLMPAATATVDGLRAKSVMIPDSIVKKIEALSGQEAH